MPEERKNLARWQDRGRGGAGGPKVLTETISENDTASLRYQGER